MARRFLDNIRADMALLYVPGGGIAAVNEGALMLDMLDSVIQDEAVIASNAASLAVPTTTSYLPLTTDIYDVGVGGDDDFITLDVINGTVTTSSTPGFTYELEGKVSFADLGSNVKINFSVLVNGVQAGFVAELTGGGGTNPRTASFSHVVLSALADAVFTIGVQTPDVADTIDINSIALSCTIQPTNNP